MEVNAWVSKDDTSLSEQELVSSKVIDTVYPHYTKMFNHKYNTINYNDPGIASQLTEDIANYCYDLTLVDAERKDFDDLTGPIAAISEDLFQGAGFLFEHTQFIKLASKRAVYLDEFVDLLISLYLDPLDIGQDGNDGFSTEFSIN